MSALLIFSMPGNEAMAAALATGLDGEFGSLDVRTFPDGETYLRFLTPLGGRDVLFVCTLARPNNKILPLLLAAATARDLGAAKVGLVAPYLAYMRQDRRFNPGEAVTSRHVARLISDNFDFLVTVDPHLHRFTSLAEIYAIPTRVVHAAPLISEWIRTNVPAPTIIGPDVESGQWVEAVAREAGAPFTVLEKVRRGDRDVEIRPQHLDRLSGRTPVLVDDIISTGRTMLEVTHLLDGIGLSRPVCIAVHGVFADGAAELLEKAGARLVTTNTVPHSTNEIDVIPSLSAALSALGRRRH